MVPRTSLFRPRRADAGGGPRGGGFRAALAALFPVAPGVPPGPGGLLRERPVRVAVEILAVAAGAEGGGSHGR